MSEYINRELAVQELEVLRQEYEMHDDCDELVAIRCRNAVSALPAADVAPARHGRWVPADQTGDCCYTCSECGFERDAYLLDVGNYCPNCGAKMDGKEGKHETD